ncbi:rhamnosyltransferase [Pseudomonas sp. NFACC23-1]|uniref:glycosyltransferase family 2 protein n=1 Tax=unclassified Pseudomonas TaxID=196821 RepID=UPI00089170BD|nr:MULTISPECIES: glycosyltransferase family 2 protein [unclassified Pseudomonas]SDB07119.1 rhamnosyltransferase [Pseudomonas sp. NFACC17-2]SEI96459.1 rhamnosyltransferase [Pseudomonas sp. NFACC23-1]SFW33394.1 rhamnosyltransferase [Pseudomonas sp. NFACC16-2]
MSRKIAVILTVYNPDVSELATNLHSYSDQVDVVVLTDNSDSTLAQQQVQALSENFFNLYLNQLSENLGIAKAQNLGVEVAKGLGCTFFIEMDQDTGLPANYVSSLLQRFDQLDEGRKIVGGIGPVALKKDTNDVYHGRNRALGCTTVEYTLSSGFLMPLYAFERVGKKNEDLFIDFVDWEWCWRSRAAGLNVFIDTSLEIAHMLGDGHKNILGFKIGVPAPIRHYYQYRNFLYFFDKKYVPTRWKIKYSLIMALKIFVFLLIFDQKKRRLGFVFKGIKDGILRKVGKIDRGLV